MWKTGTKLFRPDSPEMGVGVVVAIDGRYVETVFPEVGETLRLIAGAPGTVAVPIAVGTAVRDPKTGGALRVTSIHGARATLDTGARVELDELWPIVERPGPLERLERGDLDPFAEVVNRLEGLYLEHLRRSGAVASLAGGRIAIYPHQLATAARAIADDRVRWLLADEVGLGKTVVACLVTAALVRMGRVGKAVVVAPETLSVQWLGELYRKFHSIFTHIDAERLETIVGEFGADMNPFDAHRLTVVSLELLTTRPALLVAMQAAQAELIVVDEAHRALEMTVAPGLLDVVAAAPNALLLTTSPFQLGVEGFDRLARALDLPRRVLDDGRVVVRRVSAVTRDEVAGLPRRASRIVDVAWQGALGDPTEPRIVWLRDAARRWERAGEKALVFVNTAATAKAMVRALGADFIDTFVFHEQMDTGSRDIALARFRRSSWPLMVSTGAGSEGRNFQFVDHLVHLELPDDPTVLEQRIGRVDRIGRSGEIDIVAFRSPGPESALLDAYDRIGLLRDVIIGASPALETLRHFLVHHRPLDPGWDAAVDATLAAVARRASERTWLFADSYDPDDAAQTLAAIPADLETRLLSFCEAAAESIGVECADKGGEGRRYFEVDSGLRVDSIPGVAHGARFLGTFDRDEAIDDVDIDFFANGHPLVEGLITELADSTRGRVGVVGWKPATPTADLVVVETSDGGLECRSLSPTSEAPDLAEVLRCVTLAPVPLEAAVAPPSTLPAHRLTTAIVLRDTRRV
jgi:ATP-dependent helicase HepA